MDQRQQQQVHQRPPYPQVTQQTSSSTSTATSFFQSSSSVSSLSSTGSSTMSPASSAPLPSPSVEQHPVNYFSRAPTSHPAQQSRLSQQQQQQQPLAPQYVGQRGDGGGAPETAPLLSNFGLLAEAAKRAQMACLSRDLGDVGL
ncbi:hypothetical protein AC578_9899 [Pseudocercospora eumusae]|uniref:Uncharacterized protein n=1 Tax=Pseudocercospora eumusae TaxID=321146 RepID=A0A139HAZ1_9PEZI|nr:hypothetical protein AC578_9899 [Pseudocercospora eumusae]